MLKKRQIILPVFFAFLLFVSFSNNNIRGTNYRDTMTFGGFKRSWLIHVPLSFSISKSMPLLIVLHGGGGTAMNMVKLTLEGFDRLSDQKGFVVVYPEGIDKHWNDGRNSKVADSENENIDDVGFISALIDNLIKKMSIDPRRVYATGMSNGAIMSYRLACELSNKIAAIAPVAGNIPVNLIPGCSSSQPVSVLAINGTKDPLVPFAGGEVTGPFGMKKMGKVLSAPESVIFWARKNNCSMTPLITYEPDINPDDGTLIKKEVYNNGKNNSEVIFYIIEGGGHTWPGGNQYLGENIVGRTNRDINADEVIWSFFEKHTLQP